MFAKYLSVSLGVTTTNAVTQPVVVLGEMETAPSVTTFENSIKFYRLDLCTICTYSLSLILLRTSGSEICFVDCRAYRTKGLAVSLLFLHTSFPFRIIRSLIFLFFIILLPFCHILIFIFSSHSTSVSSPPPHPTFHQLFLYFLIIAISLFLLLFKALTCKIIGEGN